jgi:hypothetical protein
MEGVSSKLAQLQALRLARNKRHQLQRAGPPLFGKQGAVALTRVERVILADERIVALEAENKRLKAENVMLRAGKSGNVTCPKCEALKRANKKRVSKWRTKQKVNR